MTKITKAMREKILREVICFVAKESFITVMTVVGFVAIIILLNEVEGSEMTNNMFIAFVGVAILVLTFVGSRVERIVEAIKVLDRMHIEQQLERLNRELREEKWLI